MEDESEFELEVLNTSVLEDAAANASTNPSASSSAAASSAAASSSTAASISAAASSADDADFSPWVGNAGPYAAPPAVRPLQRGRAYDLEPNEVAALRAEQTDAVVNNVPWRQRGPDTDAPDAPPNWRGQPHRRGMFGGQVRYAKRGGKHKEYYAQLHRERRLVPGPGGAIVGQPGASEAIIREMWQWDTPASRTPKGKGKGGGKGDESKGNHQGIICTRPPLAGQSVVSLGFRTLGLTYYASAGGGGGGKLSAAEARATRATAAAAARLRRASAEGAQKPRRLAAESLPTPTPGRAWEARALGPLGAPRSHWGPRSPRLLAHAPEAVFPTAASHASKAVRPTAQLT